MELLNASLDLASQLLKMLQIVNGCLFLLVASLRNKNTGKKTADALMGRDVKYLFDFAQPFA